MIFYVLVETATVEEIVVQCYKSNREYTSQSNEGQQIFGYFMIVHIQKDSTPEFVEKQPICVRWNLLPLFAWFVPLIEVSRFIYYCNLTQNLTVLYLWLFSTNSVYATFISFLIFFFFWFIACQFNYTTLHLRPRCLSRKASEHRRALHKNV